MGFPGPQGSGQLTAATYTPTLTNVANSTSLSVDAAIYSVSGNLVTVDAVLRATLSVATTQTRFRCTLPVAQSVPAVGDVIGSGVARVAGYANAGVRILADTVTPSNEALLEFYPPTGPTGPFVCYVHFVYMT